MKLDWYDFHKIAERRKQRQYRINDVKNELKDNGKQLFLLFMFCVLLMIAVLVADWIL